MSNYDSRNKLRGKMSQCVQCSTCRVTSRTHFIFIDYSSGLLKVYLFDKRSETDVLQINDAGYCILVSCTKRAIRSSKEVKP